MIELFLERRQNVLMARITGVYDTAEMDRFDELLRKFVALRGEMQGLYDFSDVENVAVPLARLAERAQKAPIIGGLRILVAPKVIGIDTTRMFSERQSAAGQTAPIVVGRLEQAYVLLGLDYKAQFEPVALG